MKVAFITNYEKTIYFHAIATRLASAGHELFWIAPSGHWARWLIGHGVADEAVLDLARLGETWKHGDLTEEDRCELAVLEAASGLRVNDVILMDRILRDWPHATALRYLAVTNRAVETFLAQQDVAAVFGEQTFGVELVTGMICRRAGRALIVPHVARIPTGRMCFFHGHLQAELVGFRAVTPDHQHAAATFLESFRRDRPRPDYFLRQDRAPAPKANWPAKLVKHLRLSRGDPFDATHFSPSWLIRKRSSEVANALYHRFNRPFSVPPQPPPRPFVLFPLHRQPEASLDVQGARVSNQLEVIRALVRSLPATHELYVKEHPNGLGDRSPGFLRELAAIPGVRLVDPGVSTFALVDTAELTLTISGTAAYEAALMGRPAATMAPMFFGSILRANAFNPFADSLADLLRPTEPPSDARVIELLADVFAQSFPGAIDNPNFMPSVMDEDNLDGVGRGFLDLLSDGQAWRAPRT